MPRRPDIACHNCGELGEHAAHGICRKCYQRARREREATSDALFDRHTGALTKDDLRVLAGHHKILQGCGLVKMSGPDLLRVLDVLKPYLVDVELFLPAQELRHQSSSSEPHRARPSGAPAVHDAITNDEIAAPVDLSVTDSGADEVDDVDDE